MENQNSIANLSQYYIHSNFQDNSSLTCVLVPGVGVPTPFFFQKQTQDSRFPALDHELGPTIRAWQHRRLTVLLPVCAHFV